MVEKMAYDSAILILDHVLDTTRENPSQLSIDPKFRALVEDAEYRPQFRDLLKKYARGHSAIVTRRNEPGTPIHVTIFIVDETTEEPLTDVSVEWVQADHYGKYFDEPTTYNPRLFAYLKTNEMGQVYAKTILPSGYPDDDGKMTPKHIHFSLEKEGYRPYNGEFVFGDDPMIMEKGNLEEVPMALLIDTEPIPSYRVILPLQTQ